MAIGEFCTISAALLKRWHNKKVDSSKKPRLRVVSNFGDGDRGAGENTHARVCVFARPTIATAKIRDYSQSTKTIPNSRPERKNFPYFRPKLSKNLFPISDQKVSKTIPFGATHTYPAYIRE